MFLVSANTSSSPDPRGPTLAADGATWWIEGLGKTLAPLVRPADAVRIEPCTTRALRPGDLAVGLTPDGRPVGRVVLTAEPLVTAPLTGPAAVEELRWYGRVVAIRRHGRELPLHDAMRVATRSVARLGSWAREHQHLRRVVQRARREWTSSHTLLLRRQWVEPVLVRRLGVRDVAAVRRFGAAYLTLPPGFAEQQLTQRWSSIGAAAGAFDRRGRLVGFAFVDDYHAEGLPFDGFWVRSVYTRQVARGMGIAQRLVSLLCDLAAAQGHTLVRAAIEHDNRASIGLFKSQGFTPADVDYVAQLNRQWQKAGSTRHWVVLERPLVP